MARQGRLKRIRQRLGRRRRAPDQTGAEQAPGQQRLSFDEPGFEEQRLGELHESRREVVERRLRSLRRRSGSPRRARGALSGAGGAAQRAGAALGHAARSAADAISGTWFSIPLAVRQRIAAAAALLAAVALVIFVLVPIAPCSLPGGDRCPPGDDAIALVPSDSGAYVHLNVDTDTDQYESARLIAERLPELAGVSRSLLSSISGERIDYERDVRPWSGGELALVLDLSGTGIERMLMFEIDDGDAAQEFADSLLGKSATSTEVNGITMSSSPRGLAVAVRGSFLLVGSESQVRESIELARVDSLAVDQVAQEALGALPEERLVAAYISPELASAAQRRQLRGLDTFIDVDATEGAAVAVVVDDEGIGLSVRSVLDPARSESDPGFFATLPPYEPTLTEEVKGDALVYLGVGDPGASGAALVGRAASTAPDLFRGLKQFQRRLRRRDKIDVKRDLLPLLEGEVAVTVEPAKGGGGSGGQPETPGVVGPTGVPYLSLIAKGVDVQAALEDLAALQGPISRAVDIDAGQSPVFESRQIGGLEAQSLRLSPVVDLTYAGTEDQLIVATSPTAIERATSDAESLADSEPFKEATDSFEDQVSMLVYLDFPDLLDLGERLFLAEDPTYARFALDLRTLGAAAFAVSYTPAQMSTDARVVVGERESPEVEAPTLDLPGG